MFPPSELARPDADLDELWRGVAIILAWALKHYGPRVTERLVSFLVKRCGAVVALPVVAQLPAVVDEVGVK